MPNWCQNEVVISGYEEGSEAELERFVQDCFREVEYQYGTEKQISFKKIIPYPESAPNKGYQDEEFGKWFNDFGHDWCVDNWGTKWEPYEQENRFHYYPDEIYLNFLTAWSPPQGIYDKISKMLPKCSISWFYKEESCQISGWL